MLQKFEKKASNQWGGGRGLGDPPGSATAFDAEFHELSNGILHFTIQPTCEELFSLEP
jgi:hypothetical protein